MRVLIWVILLILAMAGGAASYLFFWPVPIDPVAWTPGPDPGFTGPFAGNEDLKLRRMGAGGQGPEDVEMDADGLLYTGLADGRITRLPKAGRPIEVFATTGGRPLGLRFDGFGNLLVADAEKGLLTIGPDGGVQVMLDRLGDTRLTFLNDLDVAADGTIYVSQSSQRHGLKQGLAEALEGRATGRLLAVNPGTGEARVLAEDLRFANGVALGPGDAYVLVAETFGYRITRVWLTRERAGARDSFVENLPGFPDNISFDPATGLFWVAMVAPRTADLDASAGDPAYRKMLYRLLSLPGVPAPRQLPLGWVLAFDAAGNVVHNLQTRESGFTAVSSVHRFGNDLYLGSIEMNALGVTAAPR